MKGVPASTQRNIMELDLVFTKPKSISLSKETKTRTEYSFFDENYRPIHLFKAVYKTQKKIKLYPFSYSDIDGIKPARISEIEFVGWETLEDLPTLIKTNSRGSLKDKRLKLVLNALCRKNSSIRKVTIKKSGKTSIAAKTASLCYSDLDAACKDVGKEIRTYNERKRFAVHKGLSTLTSSFKPEPFKLTKGTLTHYLSCHDEISLSSGDSDRLLELITHIPFGQVTVTENFIQTRNKVNVAYLEKIIAKFETLLDVKSDNEKDWQDFFEEYGWILASVFPYQVLFYDREAYVGGKTIKNDGSRLVDFLYQNGFKDNYALLEIKTHNKSLVEAKPYREPDAYAQHKDCSGAISQCLDQKNIFMTDLGKEYRVLDPKSVLIIGQKRKLNDQQKKAFELLRANQKNVDIVTFDEVLEKIYGLQSILQS